MAFLLRTFSLPARMLGSGQSIGAFAGASTGSATSWVPSIFSTGASGWLMPVTRTTGGGLVQQTRGMKVHSSIKKRSSDGKRASDTTDTCTSSASRTRDTSSGSHKTLPRPLARDDNTQTGVCTLFGATASGEQGTWDETGAIRASKFDTGHI
ncbi:Ribosomal protein [Tolypocladium capitatum]|uniref:Ribosomal protein n=1 Tax=Tolypocladium capitatum TaxID=45235 RepID=A0A2K3QAG7_9HYPO|nr:Ribosomal protein [Tolypocladium capitatum]